MRCARSFVLAFCFLPFAAFAQYYPGGLANTNLKIWLDASDAATITQSSGTVSQWNDKSGNGVNISQATAASRPAYQTNQINGLSTVQTNGTSTYLAGNYNVNGLTQMSMLSVATPATNNVSSTSSSPYAVNYPIFYWGMEIGGWGQVGMELNTQNNGFYGYGWRFGTSQASADVFYNPAAAPSGAKVMAAAHNSTVERGFYNGFNVTAPTAGSLTGKLSTLANSPTTFSVGLGQNPYGGNGYGGNNKVGEILIYNTSLNNTQLILLQNYLAAKWGVTLLANSKFTPTTATTYNWNLVGVGRESTTDSVALTRTTNGFGFRVGQTATDFLKDNGDYLCAAYTSPLAVGLSTSFLPAGTLMRWTDEWYVNKTDVNNNAGNLSIFFDFAAYGIGGSPGAPANYQLLYRSTPGSTVYSVIASAVPSVSGSMVSFAVNATAIANGYYTIGTTNITASPLPIELVNFTAVPNGKQVDLHWQTATEINNDYFTIERSQDGVETTIVATVPGAGNSNALLRYAAIDPSPLPGTSFYRLKQTDYNGTFSYSPWVAVSFAADAAVNVWINRDNELVLRSDQLLSRGTLRVFSVDGRLVLEQIISGEASEERFSTDAWRAGVYMVEIESAGRVVRRKLVHY